MRARLSRRWRFAASHRLHVDAMAPAWNAEMFGKCNNPHGHGHNYTVQVTVAGEIDPVTGMVVNLADLDGVARRELLERFGYANLNALECFRERVPSTENLAIEVWAMFSRFAEGCPGVRLERVRVEETANNSFDYYGDGVAAAQDAA